MNTDNINSKKMAYSFEELVQLKQDRRIGWLQFTLEGEHADDFMQWCKEHNIHPSEDTAEFYMESVELSMQDKQILAEEDYDYSWN